METWVWNPVYKKWHVGIFYQIAVLFISCSNSIPSILIHYWLNIILQANHQVKLINTGGLALIILIIVPNVSKCID